MNYLVYLEGAYKVRWVEDSEHDEGWWVTLGGEVLRGPFPDPDAGIEAARRYGRLTAGLPR